MFRYFIIIVVVFYYSAAFSEQSYLIESKGFACISQKNTPIETEAIAINDAKNNALRILLDTKNTDNSVKEKIKSFISDKFSDYEASIVSKNGKWDKEPPSIGDCYQVNAKVSITPKQISSGENKTITKKELLPLDIMVITNKESYSEGDTVKLYIKGNKTFYIKIIYKDSSGDMYQILPNKVRSEKSLSGGNVYEVPAPSDRFEIKIEGNGGGEEIMIFASSIEMGEIPLEEKGVLSLVKTPYEELYSKIFDLNLKPKTDNKSHIEEIFFKTIKIGSD
ncbi:MAG: DUF4384 domain-containing protein [Calditerrivibrio sp.]|nr:DUF4384 domain-containing protein [Calditerrivibrio sp.]MCA1932820.1 DUF4384 domain-containing protein [Calditerrivibrio sp.]